MTLVVDWCSADAARYACRHWHYSGTVPMDGKLAICRVGAWEDETFLGAICFSRPLPADAHRPFGVERWESGELIRVALSGQQREPTTQIVARAVRLVTSANPGWRVLLSYADPRQGHRGTIYQAMNWTYTGRTADDFEVYYKGRWWKSRETRHMGGTWGRRGGGAPAELSPEQRRELPRRTIAGKHRYALPLDRRMRRLVATMAVDYPRAA